MKRSPRKYQRGFWLLEALLAVAIFALGVIGLGKAMNNCLMAYHIMQDDTRARLALGNRMAEIESGAVQLADSTTEDLKDAFDGMTMKQTRVPLKRKNEKDQDIVGIFAVTLSVSWKSDGQDRTRELNFTFIHAGVAGVVAYSDGPPCFPSRHPLPCAPAAALRCWR